MSDMGQLLADRQLDQRHVHMAHHLLGQCRIQTAMLPHSSTAEQKRATTIEHASDNLKIPIALRYDR
jgi:hypothetical protein